MAQRILVTGAAGFIGFHLASRLLEDGCEVVGVDNLSPYYDVSLKEARLARLTQRPGFTFHRLGIEDKAAFHQAFEQAAPDAVVNLAAQPGVRYSIDHPDVYVQTNVVGFLNVLEACRTWPVRHLVYASSSSVYGANVKQPFSVEDRVDHPVSLYAATKKSNELMAFCYSHLYGIPTTGLRFFTVYGPWGRPDMAYFKFTDAILAGRPIDVYNHGKMRRDFTYVDDIVEGVVRTLRLPPEPDPEALGARYRLCNIGNHEPVELMDMIGALEQALGRKAELKMLPMQPGDVPATYADVADLERLTGFRPQTKLEEGIARFVSWYRRYRSA